MKEGIPKASILRGHPPNQINRIEPVALNAESDLTGRRLNNVNGNCINK